jgi:hypothetical protein
MMCSTTFEGEPEKTTFIRTANCLTPMGIS